MYYQSAEKEGKKSLTHKEVSFIPRWIYGAIAGKLSVSEFDNFRKLRQYLSIRDIAQLSIANQLIRNFILSSNFLGNTRAAIDVDELLNSDYYPSDKTVTGYTTRGFSEFSDPDLNEEERTELYKTANVMMKDKSFVKQIISQLGMLNEEPADDEVAAIISEYKPIDKTYQFLRHANGVICIVDEKSFSNMKTKKDMVVFMRDILQEMYAIDTFENVNGSYYYLSYLKYL